MRVNAEIKAQKADIVRAHAAFKEFTMRIRTIKPSFWSSLTIAALEIPARLTFLGLLNYADDEGRGVADPRLIKAAIWPLDDGVDPGTIQGQLEAIVAQGLIEVYESAGRSLFQVAGWEEHQKVSKPQPSSFPPPAGSAQGALSDSSLSVPGVRKEHSAREGKGGERKGEDLFRRFWEAYPLKRDKADALKAWNARLREGVDPGAMITGAEGYANDPNRELEYTKYPATWLRKGSWDDGPLPPRGTPNGRRPDPPRPMTDGEWRRFMESDA